MTMNHSLLIGSAFSALMLATGCASAPASGGDAMAMGGECHGVNACSGQGDCGGKGHGCAGKNSCKGQGWKKMAEAECKAAGGTFKAHAM